MSRDPFPEHTDVNKLFARNGVISATLPIAKLERLTANLAATDARDSAQVLVDLNFGHDDEGRRKLTGSLQASVLQLCQRCLQPLQQDLHCTLDLLVLGSEAELDELPDAGAVTTDVIVDEAGELNLVALIEDELLLSLPLAPVHEDSDCSALLNDLRQRSGASNGENQRPNPFAVLAALKQEKNGSDAS